MGLKVAKASKAKLGLLRPKSLDESFTEVAAKKWLCFVNPATGLCLC